MNTERDQVKQKIAKLLNITTDQGASENEALTAAQFAAKLMAHYDIQASELSIKNSTCIKTEVEIKSYGRINVGLFFAREVANLCDCKYWMTGDNMIFFGLPQDSEIAGYLFELVSTAIINETNLFKSGGYYKNLKANGNHGLTLVKSFIIGIETRLIERFKELQAQKKREIVASGTSLVVVKDAQINKDFQELGLRLRQTGRKTHRIGCSGAYSSGTKAGDNVQLNSGIGANVSERKAIS